MDRNLRVLHLLPMLVCLAGCRGPSLAVGRPGFPSAPSDETVVRQTVAEVMQVAADQIRMDVPLGRPPLSADELDIVEIVMSLEERQNIEVSDAALEQAAGTANVSELPKKLTLVMLAQILRQARQKQTQQRRPGRPAAATPAP